MSTDDITAIVTITGRLSMVAPDPAWSDRLRARCHTRITQHAAPALRSRKADARASIIATAVVCSFSALYLLSVVYDLVRLYRVP